MDLQGIVDLMSENACKERSNYHATLGDLIDKLKNAKKTASINPKVVGIGAYRGYYSDIALCIENGSSAYKSEIDYNLPIKEYEKLSDGNDIDINFVENPKELAKTLESLIGKFFQGYKGGFYEITRDKPLWLADDYGDCSEIAIIEITDDLKLITKKID